MIQGEERSLISATQQGDRSAFSALYEENVGKVYRYLANRLGSPEDAEDLTTDVFIRAMKSLPRYRPTDVPFVGWLFRIAHNEAVNLSKKRSRESTAPLADIFVAPESTEESAVQSLSHSELKSGMNSLTDLQQEVLNLRFGAELSISETADTMERSIQAVKFLQHSALRALRRNLGDSEGEDYVQ